MSRRVISAQFSDPNEFLAEIELDKDLVERKIVRVTKSGRPVMEGSLIRVEVLASAIVEGRIVDLRTLCGDLWGHGDEDVQERATKIVDAMTRELTKLGLEVRGGVWSDT